MPAQTDRLLGWRSVRCDPTPQSLRRDRGPTHAQHARVENASRSFHTHREPRQSTCFGRPRDNSCSRSKDGTCLMRLPCYGWCVRAACCYASSIDADGRCWALWWQTTGSWKSTFCPILNAFDRCLNARKRRTAPGGEPLKRLRRLQALFRPVANQDKKTLKQAAPANVPGVWLLYCSEIQLPANTTEVQKSRWVIRGSRLLAPVSAVPMVELTRQVTAYTPKRLPSRGPDRSGLFPFRCGNPGLKGFGPGLSV
jgi:hypothetical protein